MSLRYFIKKTVASFIYLKIDNTKKKKKSSVEGERKYVVYSSTTYFLPSLPPDNYKYYI